MSHGITGFHYAFHNNPWMTNRPILPDISHCTLILVLSSRKSRENFSVGCGINRCILLFEFFRVGTVWKKGSMTQEQTWTDKQNLNYVTVMWLEVIRSLWLHESLLMVMFFFFFCGAEHSFSGQKYLSSDARSLLVCVDLFPIIETLICIVIDIFPVAACCLLSSFCFIAKLVCWAMVTAARKM